jgi:hypothetical protein
MPRGYLKIGLLLSAAGALFFLMRLALALTSDQISAGGWTADAVIVFADDPKGYYLQLLLEGVRLAGCIVLLIVFTMRFRKGSSSRTS